MRRTYLFVPPEEQDQVRALGAQWDGTSKCWYVDADDALPEFSRWLPSAEHDAEGFAITSDTAYVATATVPCRQCQADIDVICIHCATGVVCDEPLTQFTISDIWEMDEALARQLRPWPTFRRSHDTDAEPGNFANHCPHCGEPQEDMQLHTEPDSPFFDIPRATAGLVKLTPLTGTIQLSGNEHFAVD